MLSEFAASSVLVLIPVKPFNTGEKRGKRRAFRVKSSVIHRIIRTPGPDPLSIENNFAPLISSKCFGCQRGGQGKGGKEHTCIIIRSGVLSPLRTCEGGGAAIDSLR